MPREFVRAAVQRIVKRLGHFEKVVAAGTEGVINVRALKPGRYEFYDDFNDKARGALTVQ